MRIGGSDADGNGFLRNSLTTCRIPPHDHENLEYVTISPLDPRIVPASMQFTFVSKYERTYIEWNISETVRISGGNEKRHYRYILRTLISPADARLCARQLVDAAERADSIQSGGSGHSSDFPLPPPPPPPPAKRDI